MLTHRFPTPEAITLVLPYRHYFFTISHEMSSVLSQQATGSPHNPFASSALELKAENRDPWGELLMDITKSFVGREGQSPSYRSFKIGL